MPTEKPHRPEPLTAHDPYPRPVEEADPMAERRARSAGFYAAVDEDTATRPKAPTHITRTTRHEHAATLTVDDGHGTVIALDTADPGRLGITLATAGDTLTVTVPLGAAAVLDTLLRDLAGLNLGDAAPITGSR